MHPDPDGVPLPLLALLVLVGALLGGCARHSPPPECVTLQGHAIQHATPLTSGVVQTSP